MGQEGPENGGKALQERGRDAPTPRESQGPCAVGSPRSRSGAETTSSRPGGNLAADHAAALAPGAPVPAARAPRPQALASHLPARPWRTAPGSSGSVRRRPAPAVATQPHLPHANIRLSHWSALAGAGLRRAGPRLLRSPG